METTYVILFSHTHKDDEYYTDDSSGYDVEHHTLSSGKTILNEVRVVGIKKVQEEIESIGEGNADNPPYDLYDIITVYDAETKEILPKYLWYDDRAKYSEPEWDEEPDWDYDEEGDEE